MKVYVSLGLVLLQPSLELGGYLHAPCSQQVHYNFLSAECIQV